MTISSIPIFPNSANLDKSRLQRSLRNVARKHFPGLSLPEIRWEIPQGVIYDNMDITSYVAPSCFYSKSNIIAIHPYLYARSAPMFVINYLVFHELLHAFHKGDPSNSHSDNFIADEKKAPYREKAMKWLKENSFPVMNW